jgi:ATP-dependent RNA circularization protein (DNA/RNA ligase family)
VTPPPYPRIPHLVGGRGTDDDRVLSPDEAAALLGCEVLVEEKLDGANVMVWLEDGRVETALRSGPGSADRAGQLGPLRAWAGEYADALRDLLSELGGGVLYAEWLYLTHTVAYEGLASYLVVLDLLGAEGRFLLPDERDAAAGRHGLATPPELARMVPGRLSAVEALIGRSRVGDEEMEGVVVRRLDGGQPRLAKLLRPGLVRIGDAEWARGRPRNRLADPERSWR